jgi:hypothetical protein
MACPSLSLSFERTKPLIDPSSEFRRRHPVRSGQPHGFVHHGVCDATSSSALQRKSTDAQSVKTSANAAEDRQDVDADKNLRGDGPSGSRADDTASRRPRGGRGINPELRELGDTNTLRRRPVVGLDTHAVCGHVPAASSTRRSSGPRKPAAITRTC